MIDAYKDLSLVFREDRIKRRIIRKGISTRMVDELL